MSWFPKTLSKSFRNEPPILPAHVPILSLSLCLASGKTSFPRPAAWGFPAHSGARETFFLGESRRVASLPVAPRAQPSSRQKKRPRPLRALFRSISPLSPSLSRRGFSRKPRVVFPYCLCLSFRRKRSSIFSGEEGEERQEAGLRASRMSIPTPPDRRRGWIRSGPGPVVLDFASPRPSHRRISFQGLNEAAEEEGRAQPNATSTSPSVGAKANPQRPSAGQRKERTSNKT